MNEQELNRELSASRGQALPPGVEQRLLAVLPATFAPAPPVPAVGVRTAITLLLLILSGAGAGFLAGGKGWRTLDFGQRLSLSAVLLLLAAWLAWELALRMVPAARLYSTGAAAFAATLIAVGGWAIWWTPIRAESKLFYPICLAYTSAGAAFSYWLTRRWLRRGFNVHTGFAWPTAGATALAGLAAVQLFCPLVDVAHILTSHLPPALAAGLLAAALAARRFTR